MDDICTILFADWFPIQNGFVGICTEFDGFAVYEYHFEDDLKRHWYRQKNVAYELYDELRMYLQVSQM